MKLHIMLEFMFARCIGSKTKLLRAQKQSYDKISRVVYYCLGRSIRPLVAYQTSQDFSTVHISTNVIYYESLYEGCSLKIDVSGVRL